MVDPSPKVVAWEDILEDELQTSIVTRRAVVVFESIPEKFCAWTTGCMLRCRFCHNSDTWTPTNGMPLSIERATEEMRKYANSLKVMGGGFTLSGGEHLAQHRFAVKLLRAAKDLANSFNGARPELGLTDIREEIEGIVAIFRARGLLKD